MVRIWCVLLLEFAILWPRILVAQSVDRPKDEVQIGDAWIYDNKDGITGFPISTFTSLVTEVSPNEIVTNLIIKGKGRGSFVVFDHDWNRLAIGNQKFNPNDGTGVNWPVAVGKEWQSAYTTANTQTGVNTKSTSLAKVVAQETITTSAGTFDTFKIDRQIKEFNVADPSRSWDTQMLMWFAPKINHWVRRTFIVKQEKRTIENETHELIQVVRKQ